MDRRGLLKYFGIGTTITPILNGAPIIEAAAELIAVPELKPVIADKFPDGHQGVLWYDRLRWNPFELIWLKMWQIENNPPGSINGGMGPLQHVLGRRPTPEEKAAAAAVCQWFGSNCGHAFLDETLRTCGYRVQWDETLPGYKELRAVQSAGIWPESMRERAAMPFDIKRYGRSITIRPPQASS